MIKFFTFFGFMFGGLFLCWVGGYGFTVDLLGGFLFTEVAIVSFVAMKSFNN